MAHDVFISHASRDKAIADAVCATLEQGGIRCWIAPRDVEPGADWGAALLRANKDSRVLVLVLSSAAKPLDLEVGDLIARGPVQPKLFIYVRYDVPLTVAGLDAIGCGHVDPARITPLDRPGTRDGRRGVGAALAEARARSGHFDRFVPVAAR
jgi:hypothetical protein